MVLIGVNLVQLAKPFDRDTRSSSLDVVVVSYSAITTGTTENLTLTTGVHIVQVVAFSAQHFPNDEVKTVQVTVRGEC